MKLPVVPAQVDADTLVRLDRPCPRYTSYPTADRFHDGVQAGAFKDALTRADAYPDAPLSLYVHLPFCPQLCTYCGCTVVVSNSEKRRRSYIQQVLAEMDLALPHLPRRRKVGQIHLGGGTPNACSIDELSLLMQGIASRFEVLPDAEVSLEADPRRVEPGQFERLAPLGFNRVSFGVQDFSLDVQEAIGRHQSVTETMLSVEQARAAGFASVNLDLVYGLPEQSFDDFKTTILHVLRMKPDRVALFSFAYVPHVRPHQKKIDKDTLPGAPDKAALFLYAREKFTEAGYIPVGMDHFALPDDNLGQAQVEGHLRRNFQGYTVLPEGAVPDTRDGVLPRRQLGAKGNLLAFGMSGISEIGGGYFANPRRINDYIEPLDQDKLPVARGAILDDDDLVCAALIEELMCRFKLRNDWVKAELGKDLTVDFAEAQQRLDALVDEGLVERQGDDLVVTDLGRFFVRLVAACFDERWHAAQDDDGPRYSQAV